MAAERILAASVKKSEELDVKMNIAKVDNGANLVGFLRFIMVSLFLLYFLICFLDGWGLVRVCRYCHEESKDCNFFPDEH